MTEDSAILQVFRHDAAQQRVTTQIITFDGQRQPRTTRHVIG